VIVFLLLAVYLSLVILAPSNWWALSLMYAVLGILIALVGFNIMHDGAHDSYSENSNVNLLMAGSLDVLGGSSFLWKLKHNINHHTYTNIEGMDDDIDLRPFIRIHKGQKKRWFHRYQHLYALFLYGLTYLSWVFYRDFAKYFSRKIADHTTITRMKTKVHVSFWLFKAVHIGLFLVIPALVLGFWNAIIGYLIASVTTGFILAIVFQLAHIVEGPEFTTPDTVEAKADIQSEWAIHQVQTTVNFATGNKLISWLLGGLNFQMIHHLFPKISHVHYPAIHKIVIETCDEFKLSYQEYPGMWMAIRSHLRHLKMAGRN